VVFDVDDTIKISDVRNKKALLTNTFLKEFVPVPGLAEVYTRWADLGASFHYVSASPWQLHSSLADFFKSAGLPVPVIPGLFRWVCGIRSEARHHNMARDVIRCGPCCQGCCFYGLLQVLARADRSQRTCIIR
jgi:phosphatidate phosphatase APP1